MSCHAFAQGTYEQQPQHHPPLLPPPPPRHRRRRHPRWRHRHHRLRRRTYNKQKTLVIVVRRMRRARSHWRVRCDGWGSIARKQASARRMRPGARSLRPHEAIWYIIGHDLLLLALGVAVLGKLDELLLLVLSLASAAGRHCDMCEDLCMGGSGFRV